MRGYPAFMIPGLLLSFVFTKIFFRKARLIRLPFSIKNKNFIEIGKNFTTGRGCRIDAIYRHPNQIPSLYFGENIQINDYVHIACAEKIEIGSNTLIASRVFITDHNHGSYSGETHDTPLSMPSERQIVSAPVTISERVWIGEGVSILPGVSIGSGSIIGANSVVTKNIPENSVAIGCPAKIIKKFDMDLGQWLTIEDSKK